MNDVNQEYPSYPNNPHPQVGPAPPQPAMAPLSVNRKSPALATVLSSLPGLGQIYVGYYQQGFINIMIAASIIAILSSSAGNGLEAFFGVFLAFFWLFNMIDANRRAMHFNRVAAGLGGEEIPDGFAIPGTGGSLADGALLVVVGLLLFLNSKFDMSLAWLEDWWPLALVAGGVWLMAKARQQRD